MIKKVDADTCRISGSRLRVFEAIVRSQTIASRTHTEAVPCTCAITGLPQPQILWIGTSSWCSALRHHSTPRGP